MRNLKVARVLVAGAILGSTMATHAQLHKDDAKSDGPLEVTVMYQAVRVNPVSGSGAWLQGGSVQVGAQFWRGLGEFAEIAGAHNASFSSNGVGLDLVTATFGPRYTWAYPHSRISAYGQALAGEAFGINSVFPGTAGATDNANGLAFVVGGGVNYALQHHVALRLIQADWLRTQLPNATTNVQNNLRLGAGLTMHFK